MHHYFGPSFLPVCDMSPHYLKNDSFHSDRENMKINKYIMKNNSCAKMEKLDYIHLLIFSILFRYVFSEFSVYFFPKDSAACVSK